MTELWRQKKLHRRIQTKKNSAELKAIYKLNRTEAPNLKELKTKFQGSISTNDKI